MERANSIRTSEGVSNETCGNVRRIEKCFRNICLSQRPYGRVFDFLNAEIAEGAYQELMKDPRYQRTDKMAEPTGVGLGYLMSIDRSLSPKVQKCCEVLTSMDFLSWLTRLIEGPLQIARPPTLVRMERGDRVTVHDDILNYPLNRVSVVLHLSKNWKRGFGGNTVVGPVKRVENLRFGTSEHLEHRWVLSNKRSVLTPAFNSLLLIALRPGMAHGVTTLRSDACRVSITSVYALDAQNLSFCDAEGQVSP